MGKNIDRLLLLMVALSTLGALAIGFYGIQEERAAISDMEEAEASGEINP